MAVPQGRPRRRHEPPARLPANHPERTVPGTSPGRGKPSRAHRKRAARARGMFVALVLVPAALMLGSVYLHAEADRVSAESDRLAAEKADVEVEAERLQVRLEELSGPARVREAARRALGMRDPSGADIETYKGESLKGDGAVEGESGG